MLIRLLCLSLFLLTFAAAAGAQTVVTPANPNIGGRRSPTDDDDPPPRGSPMEEMLDRAMIKSLEEAHKETVERAKETAQLGVELRESFKNTRALGRDDLKRLERMEKLSRSIRSRAGGSDDGDPLTDPPRSLDAALARLAASSDELRKQVEKTSRHVVSTAVIERANELIELIRLIRGFK